MLASRPVTSNALLPTLLPTLHAVVYPLGLALWAAALVGEFASSSPRPALRRLASAGSTRRLQAGLRAVRGPATLVALFGGISLFHHQPAQWFTLPGKLQIGLVLTLMGLDAVAQRRSNGAPSWQI